MQAIREDFRGRNRACCYLSRGENASWRFRRCRACVCAACFLLWCRETCGRTRFSFSGPLCSIGLCLLVGGDEFEAFDGEIFSTISLDGNDVAIDLGVFKISSIHANFLERIGRVVEDYFVSRSADYFKHVNIQVVFVVQKDAGSVRVPKHLDGFVVVGLAHGDYYTDFREKVKRVFILFLRI